MKVELLELVAEVEAKIKPCEIEYIPMHQWHCSTHGLHWGSTTQTNTCPRAYPKDAISDLHTLAWVVSIVTTAAKKHETLDSITLLAAMSEPMRYRADD